MGAKLAGDGRTLLGDLLLQLRVALRQLVELDQVPGAPLQPIPGPEQLSMLGGFAGRLTGPAGVIPGARLLEVLL